MPLVHYCSFCHARVPTIDGMKRHYAQKTECRKMFQAEIGKSIVTVFDEEIDVPLQPPSPKAHLSDDESLTENDDAAMPGDDFAPRPAHARSPTADSILAGPKPKRVRVEEVDDDDAPTIGRYTEEYPGRVADALGKDKTKFERIRDDQMMEGIEPHAPFADEEEWELVRWLMKNVGQSKADDFLKLPIVSHSFISSNYTITNSALADEESVEFINAQQPFPSREG